MVLFAHYCQAALNAKRNLLFSRNALFKSFTKVVHSLQKGI